MSISIGVARALASDRSARLATAFVEIVLATAILCGSIVLGHELRSWREWYYDPATAHPWAPTPRPADVPEVAAPALDPR